MSLWAGDRRRRGPTRRGLQLLAPRRRRLLGGGPRVRPRLEHVLLFHHITQVSPFCFVFCQSSPLSRKPHARDKSLFFSVASPRCVVPLSGAADGAPLLGVCSREGTLGVWRARGDSRGKQKKLAAAALRLSRRFARLSPIRSRRYSLVERESLKGALSQRCVDECAELRVLANDTSSSLDASKLGRRLSKIRVFERGKKTRERGEREPFLHRARFENHRARIIRVSTLARDEVSREGAQACGCRLRGGVFAARRDRFFFFFLLFFELFPKHESENHTPCTQIQARERDREGEGAYSRRSLPILPKPRLSRFPVTLCDARRRARRRS